MVLVCPVVDGFEPAFDTRLLEFSDDIRKRLSSEIESNTELLS